jgi:hypothetical protein
MGVDFYNCTVCGEIFSDAGYFGHCINCEGMMCGHCHDEMATKYGFIDENDERVGWYGEDAVKHCNACDKPTLDVNKFEKLMYFLIKDSAKYSFREFLEEIGLTDDDYQEIKKYLKETYGIKTYL